MMRASKSHLQESGIDIDFRTGKIDIYDPIPISFFTKACYILVTMWLTFGVPILVVGVTFSQLFYGNRVLMQESLRPTILFMMFGLILLIFVLGFIFIGYTTRMLANVAVFFCRKYRIEKIGEMGASEFSFIFKNKFIHYTMEEDYADYRSKIEIKPIIEFSKNGKQRIRFWTATFKFTQEPINGRIEIFYN